MGEYQNGAGANVVCGFGCEGDDWPKAVESE